MAELNGRLEQQQINVVYIKSIRKENSEIWNVLESRTNSFTHLPGCLAFYLRYNDGKLHPVDDYFDLDLVYKKPIPSMPPPHPSFPNAQPHLVMPEFMDSLGTKYNIYIYPLLRP